MTAGRPRFSVIVPAFNEAAFLPRLLRSVDVARRRHAGGVQEIEIIVVDNGCTDDTAAIAASRGCRVVRESRRIIAASRNRGASVAKGEILAFVDADSRIHPHTFTAIDRALEDASVIAGATGVTMERWSAGIALTYAMFLPLVWIAGFDTGVVFCRKSDFEAVGGYREDFLFAEDVRFLMDLARQGYRSGRRLVRLRGVKTVASTRKFDRHGDWHYFPLVFRSLPSLTRPQAQRQPFVRAYWYDDVR